MSLSGIQNYFYGLFNTENANTSDSSLCYFFSKKHVPRNICFCKKVKKYRMKIWCERKFRLYLLTQSFLYILP